MERKEGDKGGNKELKNDGFQWDEGFQEIENLSLWEIGSEVDEEWVPMWNEMNDYQFLYQLLFVLKMAFCFFSFLFSYNTYWDS